MYLCMLCIPDCLCKDHTLMREVGGRVLPTVIFRDGKRVENHDILRGGRGGGAGRRGEFIVLLPDK